MAPPPVKKEEGCLNWLCVAKIIFSPIILLVMAFKIYVFGCFGAYIERTARGMFCGLCVCCSCTYKDKAFPHDHRSIGTWQGHTGAALDQKITWRRIGEICSAPEPGSQPRGKDGKPVPTKGINAPKARLFSGGIEPADICQGEIGDCWLMSALACLATKRGAIEQVFITREYNMYGRYRLRLYNGAARRWQTVVVDDWIPCRATDGRPIFAKPNGDEAWVLILEKAMAKFMGGSYAKLDGNLMIKAMEILTGDFTCIFQLADPRDKNFLNVPRMHTRWTRIELARPAAPGSKAAKREAEEGPAGDLRLVYARDQPFDQDTMYRSICYELGKGSTIGASNSGKGLADTQQVQGIVQGHAYAIIGAAEAEEKRFVRLRNPWGKFEWTGPWSDKSPLWDANPKVKAALKWVATDDGCFFMEWSDFITHFNSLEFCCRSTGFDHVVINIHEEHPCCGPTWGCIEGCFRYWVCCLGVSALCCGRRVTEFKRPPKGCCACLQ